MNVSENYTNKLCYNDLGIYEHQILESRIDNLLENCLKPQVITIIFTLTQNKIIHTWLFYKYIFHSTLAPNH